MTRTRRAFSPTIGLVGIGLAAAVGLAGCGAGSVSTAAGVGADVSDEAVALQQVGFDTGLQNSPDPSASAGSNANSAVGKRAPHRAAIRRYLRKNTLHGEVAVETGSGVRTIVVQRGSVTAVNGKTVTVKSTDGFVLTWTLADKVAVVQNRKKVETSAVKVGEQVGVAGTKDGSADDARLIAVK